MSCNIKNHSTKLWKISSIILTLLIIFSSFSIFSFADNTTVLKEVRANDDRSNITISVSAPANETVKVYKTVLSKTSLVKTVEGTGQPIEVELTFSEIPCFEITSVTVHTENEAGEKSQALSFNARGPHKSGDWQIIKNPTCDTAGSAEIKCSNCNKSLQTKSLSSYGHAWGTPSWSWSNDYKSATATFTCKHDASHKKTVTDSAVELSKTEQPTCKEAGFNTYVASVTFEGKSYSTAKTVTLNRLNHTLSDWTVLEKATCIKPGTQIKKCTLCQEIIEHKEIEPIKHNFVLTYSWSSDYTECYATAICKNDESHVETETVTAVEITEAEATCVKSGRIARKAIFTNPIFTEQVKKATVTGLHVDKNNDTVCDVCRMKLTQSDTTQTTTNRNVFDDNTNPDSVITDDNGQSLVFDEEPEITEPESNSNNDDNKPTEQEKPITRKIIVVVIVMAVCIVGATICTILLVKTIKNKPSENKADDDDDDDTDLYE